VFKRFYLYREGSNRMSIKAGYILALIILFSAGHAFAQQGDLSPFGFQFGISEGDAEDAIELSGKRIMEDNVDSKDIRTIIIQGTMVDMPLDLEGRDVRTGLEFYDDKLLTSSLIVVLKDSLEESEVRNKFTKYLTEKYGEPSDSDSMLYFKTWTWQMPDVKLVLHSNDKDKLVKIEYTYKPVSEVKREDELDAARGTEPKDPAKQMFLDGDYSKPTAYRE
jgi:hypothetical protein